MATRLGADLMLWVSTAVDGTFNMIKDEQTGSISQAAADIDVSSKASWPNAISRAGRITRSIQLSGVTNLPDANGLELVFGAFKTGGTVFVQVRKDGTAGVSADAVFACEMCCTQFDLDRGAEVETFNFTLMPAAAPTVDDLTPA